MADEEKKIAPEAADEEKAAPVVTVDDTASKPAAAKPAAVKKTAAKKAPAEKKAPVEKKASVEKKTGKGKKAAKVEIKDKKAISKASLRDYDLIISPVITEKTMKLMQEQNKVTVRVPKSANRAEVKKAFERVFGVAVTDVNIINVRAKETRRGGRYKGSIPGFKKAIVTVHEGEAIDLFKE